MGDRGISNQSMTGHGPSSHRSLDLERLNTEELQISPTTSHQSPGNRPPVTGHQTLYQPISSETHASGMFTSNQPNSSRVLLLLEPDFSNMSDPSVVVELLGNNWRSDNRQISQASLSGRTSMRDQPRNKNKIKKRRRHRSSSTSSSSRSASSDSRRTQAVQNPDILQPEEVTNVQTITPEQTLLHPSKDSGSESEMETWSFDRAINEVFRLLPPELCPRSAEEHTVAKPLSGIEHLKRLHY